MDIKTAIVDLRKATGWDNLDEIKAKLDPPYKAVLKIGQHMSGGGSDGSVSGVRLKLVINHRRQNMKKSRSRCFRCWSESSDMILMFFE
ncbi:hypothetical protein GIB67_041976 [Kingdonia uniflora]|uniref:Uncharacterized protein n=1 Tax=Kingdonia uniflora TaxID=39325 RepID=A0A7J7NZY1_9MAGN|nr:hypothetical protein GIB67_041976 [Kingdonia uniflora]